MPEKIEAHEEPGPEERRAIREERGENETVRRQARRAGHERQDQDGREALARITDDTGGRDGRHRARVAHQQGQEAATAQAESTQQAIDEECSARQISACLEKLESDRQDDDLGHEGEHGACAAENAVADERRGEGPCRTGARGRRARDRSADP